MTDTNIQRWKELAETSEAPVWSARNVIIAKLIPEKAHILDIGCGNKDLKNFLPSNVSYCGLDCFGEEADDMIVLDFNTTNAWAVLLLKKFDYIVCSGVLEYIINPNTFLHFISQNAKYCIVSYALSENRSIVHNKPTGWVNDLTRYQLSDMFKENGLTCKIEGKYENQAIFVLESA